MNKLNIHIKGKPKWCILLADNIFKFMKVQMQLILNLNDGKKIC